MSPGLKGIRHTRLDRNVSCVVRYQVVMKKTQINVLIKGLVLFFFLRMYMGASVSQIDVVYKDLSFWY